MKDNLFIVNPVSGRGKTLRVWSEVRRELVQSGADFDEYITSRAGDGIEVTREAISNGTRRVITVGGDGTLSEVVNGYLDKEGQPINAQASIGLFASGTGSDFRRSLHTANDKDQIASLLKSDARRIDATRATYITKSKAEETRHFINLASFGLGGDVVAMVNGWRESLPGWIGGRSRYAAGALIALSRYRNTSVKVTLDREEVTEVEGNLLIVANGRFAGGGMMFAPQAQIDDGLLDVLLTDGLTRLDIIRELLRIRSGGHLKNPKIKYLRGRKVSFETATPLSLDLDGEMVGSTPANFEILPGAIRFATAICAG